MEEHHIVKADEVDQTGTDITTVSDDQLMEEVAQGLRQEQASKATSAGPNESQEQRPNPSRRPELRRNVSAPPPPLQPPPPAPVQQLPDRPPDSLSLAQLKQIVQDMPKVNQPAYAFEYADSQPLVEEIEEWFQYSEFDRIMLLGMKSTFERKWASFCENQSAVSDRLPWLDAPHDLRKSFMEQIINGLPDRDISSRTEALEVVCYALTGIWGSTAGKAVPDYPEDLPPQAVTDTPKSKSLQIIWMQRNAELVNECSGLGPLLSCLCKALEKNRSSYNPESDGLDSHSDSANVAASEHEVNLVLTALYIVVEIGRRQEKHSQDVSLRDALMGLKPNLSVFLVEVIARLRWDDSANIPLTRIILLFWKCLLLFFGGSDSLKKAKEELEPRMEARENSPNRRTPFLTASPLDYHLFRQEITSKYPAYNPPLPVVPLELENNSILPPLPQHPSRTSSSTGLFSGVGPSVAGGNGSILHQSVHIATPAPSPPPSPIGPGGKAGKKQNYQTNQNFPFMYPPLDDSSNDIGGKGSAERQDALVGKRWEGSDVPASIIEAGKLFSTHVKMTRAMRQLWEERERFMKYDRGWYLDENSPSSDEDPSGELAEDLENLVLEGRKKSSHSWAPQRETDNDDIQRRLDAVESFYSQVLVHLQSITIVFLKIILTNVSAMVNPASGQNGHAMSDGYGAVNGFPAAPNSFSDSFNADAAIEELDNIRLREITGKAISGSLLLMLKWFKRSHILKFEYMTQLLLDSNYLPLILKMFAHQDIDQAIAQKNDREELGFFHFCHVHSDQPPNSADNSEEDSSPSDDEAVPPPILRHRRDTDPGTSSVRPPSPQEALPELVEGAHRPEVDELGFPTAPPPKEPITVFSFRNFFSAINYLHIMQKITRDKAHRCLLLVQYKSSTILRKGLKIPDPHLRFYTLKLFKSQSYGMTGWLGTHWWHLRRYKDVMGGGEGASMMEEERDFFVRELEAMGWGFAGEEMMNEEAEMAANGVMMNGTEWDGGPLQMEGW
ncbi:hypothetical protein KXV96_008194 [Aspergillus fumigatus]|nr:hypothetical protein KXV96_008194 [Aspergillus fumigatus]